MARKKVRLIPVERAKKYASDNAERFYAAQHRRWKNTVIAAINRSVKRHRSSEYMEDCIVGLPRWAFDGYRERIMQFCLENGYAAVVDDIVGGKVSENFTLRFIPQCKESDLL